MPENIVRIFSGSRFSRMANSVCAGNKKKILVIRETLCKGSCPWWKQARKRENVSGMREEGIEKNGAGNVKSQAPKHSSV